MSQSLSDLRQSVPSDVRELLQHQLESWQQGTRLPIETIVTKAKPEHRVVAAQVLIKQEIVLREQAGEAPRLDEYISRFPEVAGCLPKDLGSEFEMTMAVDGSAIQHGDVGHDTYDQTLERTFASSPIVPAPNSAVFRAPSPDVFGGNAEPTKGGVQKRDDHVNRMIGPYRLEKKLGQGGMGAVFKAIHTKLDKTVAIKVMSRQGTLDDTAVERFEREMRAVGRIEHPHVIRAMDAGEADGFHYLVMEYVEGTDVSQLVKKQGPFPIGQACEIIRQSALGLHEAHLLGLVHRDIKPSNLFLTQKGIVKILDLGLARLSEGQTQNLELTQSGLCMGTPDYMAPEQWVSARDVDGRCDFYALGCTMFHLLIGRPPFGTKEHLSLGNKVLAHTSGVIPDIRLLCADFPEKLKPILDRMLAKERNQRFASGEELAQALQPYCSPLPGADHISHSDISALPQSAPQKPRSTHWSRHLAFWGGGAAVLVLAGFIIIKVTDKHGRETIVKVNSPSSVSVSVEDDDGIASETLISTEGKSNKPKVLSTKSSASKVEDSGSEVAKGELNSKTAANKATEKKPGSSGDAALSGRPILAAVATEPSNPKMEKGGAGKPGAPVSPSEDAPGVPDTPAKTAEPPKTKPPTVVAAVPSPVNPLPTVEKIIPATLLKLPMPADSIAKLQAAWSREVKRPVTKSNTLEMPFVLIPPGEFDMGVIPDEAVGVNSDQTASPSRSKQFDRPRHRVRITQPFAIGQYEVTVGQFRQFVNATRYKTLAERETATGVSLSEGLIQNKRLRQPSFSWQFAGEFPVEDIQPVTNLSWYDAVAFCEWLSQKEGLTYRLPTEAEWEYVARAGAGTFADGSEELLTSIKQGSNLADISGKREFSSSGFVTNSVDWDDTFAAQSPVGRFSQNTLGLHDLCGNVAEWCADRYDAEYYKAAPLENPRGPSSGAFRVIRGASWQSTVTDCRPELRGFAIPTQAQLNVGFRLIQELPNHLESEVPKAAPTPAQRDLVIAGWVLKSGGKVRVAINRAPSNEISKPDHLPTPTPGNEYTLYTIDLSLTGISDRGLEQLKPLTGLQDLNLSGNPITDASLEMLKSLRVLSKLNLSQTHVTGSGLNHLVNNKKLAELDLSCCPITDISISPISGLTSLTAVRLNSTPVSDSALELLKPLKSLKELTLADTRVTGTGIAHLKYLPALTILDLSQTPLDNKSLKSLANLKVLQQLRFNWSTVSDMGLECLQESYTLKDVGLRGTEVGYFTVGTLEKLKGIRKLDLRETDVSETDLAVLEKALKTKVEFSNREVNARVASLCLSLGGKVVITLDSTPVPQTITQFGALPASGYKVSEIHLTDLPVSDGVLLLAPKLTGLKVLNLNGTNIDDAGMAALARAPKLESLSLEGTRITAHALAEISAIKTLKKLSIRNNRISEDKVAELRGTLRGVEIQ